MRSAFYSPAVVLPLLLLACASQAPSVPAVASAAATSQVCTQTTINVTYDTPPEPFWKQRIDSSAVLASAILRSQEFGDRCRGKNMSRRNGQSVEQVCRELQCAGAVNPKVDFFNDPRTKAIASEGAGEVHINTAKAEFGAGSPGNLAHEMAHTLGYRHFTNVRRFAQQGVPYVVGDLVDEIADRDRRR